MNYIGSKYSLLPFLKSTISDVVGDNLSEMTFCDLFAGTGIVGRAFKADVKKIISNDSQYYSFVLNRNYIGNHTIIPGKEEYIDCLNNLNGIDTGFIYNNYCAGSGCGRLYYSDENGRKIDAIRSQIEEWKQKQIISDDLFFFLLSSLLESSDKRANTASVYGAFLKQIKATAKKPLIIQPAEFAINTNHHEVYCADSNLLIKHIHGDILYLDPPYNARQYGSNYHLLNTIAEYKPFIPKGKTGLRDYDKSSYCSRKTVLPSLESLIRDAQFKFIFLSYNNEGLMSPEIIKRTMSKYGKYDLVKCDYHRFRADTLEKRNHSATKTTEYMHILVKE